MDPEAGELEVGGRTYHFAPYPQSLARIIESGGLIPYLSRTIAGEP